MIIRYDEKLKFLSPQPRETGPTLHFDKQREIHHVLGFQLSSRFCFLRVLVPLWRRTLVFLTPE
jgi:hypothetical protein